MELRELLGNMPISHLVNSFGKDIDKVPELADHHPDSKASLSR